MIDLQTGLCVVAEPVKIPDSPYWFGSNDGRAAIRCNSEILRRSCLLVKRGRHFVAVKCDDVIVISSYVSPNLSLTGFLDFLEELSEAVRDLNGKVILCGDYNAKSALWGFPVTDTRGAYVEKWAAACDLRLQNTGNSPTCVRPQGSSIVDLTWVSSLAIGLVDGWMVRSDIETLSDHLYVTFTVGNRPACAGGNALSRRWNLSKMDGATFALSLEWACGDDPLEANPRSALEHACWIDGIMEEACDASSPRMGPKPPRNMAYWWSDSIAGLKGECVRARRLWMREKRKVRRPPDVLLALENDYRLRKKDLRRAINKAKAEAWRELIKTIDENPWGLPYRLVMNRLRQSSPSFSELIDPNVLERLVDGLFSGGSDRDAPACWRDWQWSDDWSISYAEVFEFIKKRDANNAAPGPDGFRSTL